MSSDLALAVGRVPLLTGQSNYREWAIEVKSAAQLANIYKALAGTDKEASSDAADILAFQNREEKAIGLIFRTVSTRVQLEIRHISN